MMKLFFLIVTIIPFLTRVYAPLPQYTYEQMQHMAPPGGWERFQQQQQQQILTQTQPQQYFTQQQAQPQRYHAQRQRHQQQRNTFHIAEAETDDTMLIELGDGGMDGGLTAAIAADPSALTAAGNGDGSQKMALTPQYVELPSKTQQTQFAMAAPAPVKALAAQTLPAETLQAQVGDTLQLQKLPQLTSQTTETLPVQMITPAKAQTLQPQVRQQIINQDVIQPIVQTQPYLRVRHITQNVYQPTMQKQPVIQPVITQPVLNRVIHQQPIIQQQLQEQTVVKRRVINQPQVQQVLQTQYQKAPQQVQETLGEALPAQTQMNAKVAAILGGQVNGNGYANGGGYGGADQFQGQLQF